MAQKNAPELQCLHSFRKLHVRTKKDHSFGNDPFFSAISDVAETLFSAFAALIRVYCAISFMPSIWRRIAM